MNHFFLCLVLLAAFLAILGWATHACHQRDEPTEKMFSTLRAFILAGIFLAIALVLNYYLCSTGLQRSMGGERLGRHDPFGSLLFEGSGMRTNHLWALGIVIFSFVSAAWFLSCVGRLVRQRIEHARAVQVNNAVPHHHDPVWKLIIELVAASTMMSIGFYLDTSLLLFRSATMMWPNEMAETAASLPEIGRVIAQHSGTMGAFLLFLLSFWYPAFILMAEKHFASCKAHYSAACRKRAQLQDAPARPAPVVPIAPVPPMAPAPPAPAPRVVPAGPLPPVPGGVAFNRPIPFAVPPGNGNGPAGG